MEGNLKTKTLKSTVNSEVVKEEIKKAARIKFGPPPYPITDMFFEHGHWWLTVFDFHGEDGDATFDVVDAEPGLGDTGLDFEEV